MMNYQEREENERMLEIKTITDYSSKRFDNAVNEALSEGWGLVRRECFITGSDRATTFYAELERFIDEPEEDSGSEVRWLLTRNPHNPYKCSNCGYTAREQWATCPECESPMAKVEE